MRVSAILFILIHLGCGESLHAQTPTTHPPQSVSAVIRERIALIKPADELINNIPKTLYDSQGYDGVIPGARVTYVIDTSTEAKTDTIREIEFYESLPIPNATSRKEAAELFLKQHKDLLKISQDLSELSFVKEKPFGQSTSVRFEQRYGGLKVLFGELSVIVDPDFSIYSLMNDVIPITPPPPTENYKPTNSEAAIKAAKAALNASWVENVQAYIEAVVYVEEGEPRVVWKIRLHHDDFDYFALERWEGLFDVNTLKPILFRRVTSH